MSYRNPVQSIEEPSQELLNGIRSFCNAVEERIMSDEWSDAHIDKLTLLTSELAPIKLKLLRLARETW